MPHVGVVVDPADYGAVLEDLDTGGALSGSLRRRLARKAFAHCAAYDAAIVAWLDAGSPERSEPAPEALPPSLLLRLRRAEVLRYGENPQQVAARYRVGDAASWWDTAAQLGGKPMSYLNVYDTDAAWRLAHGLGPDPAAVVVKHANPCGAAAHDDIAEAYRRAHACDPVSAFGGVVALNRPVTPELAASLADVFTEVVVAPATTPRRSSGCRPNPTCASCRPPPRRPPRCICARSATRFWCRRPRPPERTVPTVAATSPKSPARALVRVEQPLGTPPARGRW